MRYLVISDIHANLEAYDTVHGARPARSAGTASSSSAIWSATAATPMPSCERVRALGPHALIRGNHDKVGSGIETADGFNAVARSAIRWTFDTLTDDNRAVAGRAARRPGRRGRQPSRSATARPSTKTRTCSTISTRSAPCTPRAGSLCLFGHTHVQVGYSLAHNQFAVETNGDARPFDIALEADTKYLINPGSVGQPRDGDPRAGFAIVDTDTRHGGDSPHSVPDRQGPGADCRRRSAGDSGRAAGGWDGEELKIW